MAQKKIEVDENLMRAIISEGIPKEQKELPPKKEKPKRSVPLKTDNKEEYLKTYFQKRELKDRQPIYISGETHAKLKKIIMVIGNNEITISSYLENALSCHLESFQSCINEIYQEKLKDLV